jgi:hypothetical protein
VKIYVEFISFFSLCYLTLIATVEPIELPLSALSTLASLSLRTQQFIFVVFNIYKHKSNSG